MKDIVSFVVFTALLPILLPIAAAHVVYDLIIIAWCEIGGDLSDWLGWHQ